MEEWRVRGVVSQSWPDWGGRWIRPSDELPSWHLAVKLLAHEVEGAARKVVGSIERLRAFLDDERVRVGIKEFRSRRQIERTRPRWKAGDHLTIEADFQRL